MAKKSDVVTIAFFLALPFIVALCLFVVFHFGNELPWKPVRIALKTGRDYLELFMFLAIICVPYCLLQIVKKIMKKLKGKSIDREAPSDIEVAENEEEMSRTRNTFYFFFNRRP